MENPLVLYHVTRREYSDGQVVLRRDVWNQFVERIHEEERGWVEERFERLRPPACPSRYTAIFAFDSLGACLRFANGEERQRGTLGAADWKYYVVELMSPTRHPICLVDFVDKLGVDLDVGRLVREYWRPTREWKRYEYLGSQMQVLDLVAPPDRELAEQDLTRALLDRDTMLQMQLNRG